MSNDTLQAISHKIELNEEKEARREQVGTLHAIAHKIELNEEQETRRVQVGTLKVIAHKIELNEEKEARRTGRHAPGGLGTGPNGREEESETRQADTGKPSRTDMEEPMDAVTSITRNLSRFDGTKPENHRDWYSKTRVVLSLPNEDLSGVLNGTAEPIPGFTHTDTPDAPTNLVEVSRWKRACEHLFSIMHLINSGPAAHWFDNTKTGLWWEVWKTDSRRGALCTPHDTTARGMTGLLREASELSDGARAGS